MNLDDLWGELEHLTPEQYGYLGLLALVGPMILRLFGFKMLARLARPLALAMIGAAAYARQQNYGES